MLVDIWHPMRVKAQQKSLDLCMRHCIFGRFFRLLALCVSPYLFSLNVLVRFLLFYLS